MSSPTVHLADLKTADLERQDLLFSDGEWTYSTAGRCLGQGGTGNAWLATRWHPERPEAPPEPIVVKLFRDEMLFLLRDDENARRHFEHNRLVLDRLRGVDHPYIVPVLHAGNIADNFVVVSPLVGESLVGLLAARALAPKGRVQLLCDALRGLAALHQHGIVHRDFSLYNVLTLGESIGAGIARHAAVFDYDLAVCPDLLPEAMKSWAGYYGRRVAGAPEFTVPPEAVDDALAHEAISPRADVYSIGTALYHLFTGQSIYGDAPDLATLLYRISDGVVRGGDVRILFPDEVPRPVRPIIEMCLERDPAARYADASAVLLAVEDAMAQLPATEPRGRHRVTVGYVAPERRSRQDAIHAARVDHSVTLDEIRRIDGVLARSGYVVEKSLGRVKGHPIYLAAPDAALVATGRFAEDNTYRKIVTAIDVGARDDGAAFVEAWLGRIRPIVDRVRQGLMTSLYKAVHDKPSNLLLLFTEYVADPRFGTDLVRHDLPLEEALGLGLIVTLSIERLHREGLAHNNVRAESLLFKGRRDVGQVKPMMIGLVEPSFSVDAREEDVRDVARLVGGWLQKPRIDALAPTLRPSLAGLYADLVSIADGFYRTPTIGMLVDSLETGLGAVDGNFELVRRHGGDVFAYADLVVRHSLYNKLYVS